MTFYEIWLKKLKLKHANVHHEHFPKWQISRLWWPSSRARTDSRSTAPISHHQLLNAVFCEHDLASRVQKALIFIDEVPLRLFSREIVNKGKSPKFPPPLAPLNSIFTRCEKGSHPHCWLVDDSSSGRNFTSPPHPRWCPRCQRLPRWCFDELLTENGARENYSEMMSKFIQNTSRHTSTQQFELEMWSASSVPGWQAEQIKNVKKTSLFCAARRFPFNINFRDSRGSSAAPPPVSRYLFIFIFLTKLNLCVSQVIARSGSSACFPLLRKLLTLKIEICCRGTWSKQRTRRKKKWVGSCRGKCHKYVSDSLGPVCVSWFDGLRHSETLSPVCGLARVKRECEYWIGIGFGWESIWKHGNCTELKSTETQSEWSLKLIKNRKDWSPILLESTQE